LLGHRVPAAARLRIPRPWRSEAAIAALFVVSVLPINLYLSAWRFVDLGRHDHPYYLHRDEVAAMHWLEANSAPFDVVLSSLTTGQYIPSIAGNPAFLAHWAQTLDFLDKRRMVSRFFDAAGPEPDRLAVLTRYGVRYVL